MVMVNWLSNTAIEVLCTYTHQSSTDSVIIALWVWASGVMYFFWLISEKWVCVLVSLRWTFRQHKNALFCYGPGTFVLWAAAAIMCWYKTDTIKTVHQDWKNGTIAFSKLLTWDIPWCVSIWKRIDTIVILAIRKFAKKHIVLYHEDG